MRPKDFNIILQRLDRIENAIEAVRTLVLALVEDTVDSDFYSGQIKKLNQEKRDLEYQNALMGKYTIDHNGRMSEK